jgi:hypothetical protein
VRGTDCRLIESLALQFARLFNFLDILSLIFNIAKEYDQSLLKEETNDIGANGQLPMVNENHADKNGSYS